MTRTRQILSNLPTSFLGLQKVKKCLAIRYISKAVAVDRSVPVPKTESTFFRTSFSIRIRVSQPRMTDWSFTAAFSRSRPAFLASLAALVDSRKASLLSLFEDIILKPIDKGLPRLHFCFLAKKFLKNHKPYFSSNHKILWTISIKMKQ